MVVYNCVDDEDFIAKSDYGIGKRVILYFYLNRGEKCQKIQPVFEDLCQKYQQSAIIYTYEVYSDDLLVGEAFNIKKAPTVIVMDDGNEIERIEEPDEETMKQFFERYAVEQ
ncbi:unnamed protein product [Caenorhabditis bovis]|uniref:Thioredoxin domain-containing protein n=1 Tax=Caenorhabditis bovis TaxID=2654633 RepID=A0A8S1F912_9PELO|nr:unnamed protein product [Caenorhabditis bovis]